MPKPSTPTTLHTKADTERRLNARFRRYGEFADLTKRELDAINNPAHEVWRDKRERVTLRLKMRRRKLTVQMYRRETDVVEQVPYEIPVVPCELWNSEVIE